MKDNLLKAAVLAYIGICSMLFFGTDADAYIDPSVMTYVIQAAAGIAIAVGATVAVYVRKAKKAINNKLGIDENRNKEVESDDIMAKEAPESKE